MSVSTNTDNSENTSVKKQTIHATVLASFDALFAQVNDDTLIITPNKRLSRFVQSQYSDYQQRQEKQAWPSLNCLSLTSWLTDLWSQAQLTPESGFTERLLDNTQGQFIWQNIVNTHSHDLELFNINGAAKSASDAWQYLIKWQLNPLDSAHHNPPGESPFKQWAEAFKEYCCTQQLIDLASAQKKLTDSLSHLAIIKPQKLLLLAFDDLSPLDHHFFNCLNNHSCTVEQVDIHQAHTHLVKVETSDEIAEIRCAAQWAHNQLQQNSTQKIAVVIPELAKNRIQVEHIFTEIFEPQYSLPSTQPHATGFNISASQPLAQAPIIKSALTALKLNASNLSVKEASYLLHSPFIGDYTELASRSRLSHTLREQQETIRVSFLRAQISQQATPLTDTTPGALSSTHECFNQLHQLTEKASKPTQASQWVNIFNLQLQAIGWPGQRQLDTLEYQQWNQWQSVLDSFIELEYLFPTFNFNDALYYLEQTAQSIAFQAQTTDSPIQVLGMLEAAGLSFDAIWVTGIDDQHWPEKPAPNPLIPPALQRKLNMPRASSDKERALATRLTQRLSTSAAHVIFSYSSYREDQAQQVSQLISNINSADLLTLVGDINTNHYQQLLAHQKLESIIDNRAPAISDATNIKGGSQIIKDQAACPFKAFAAHRLNAKDYNDYQPGLNALERGNLIHSCLEIIWRQLTHWQNLIDLTSEQKKSLIDNAINDSIIQLKRNEPIGKQLLSIERQRLATLLDTWLTIDAKRAPFTVVDNESSQKVMLHSLPINIRYDRIDELEDGSRLIIDYKTGNTNINSWFSHRPDEPQLPLYCVTSESDINAIAFGEINAKTVALKGVGATDDIGQGIVSFDNFYQKNNKKLPELPTNWPDLLNYWQDNISTLAKNFISGDASVNPKSSASCQYCKLHSLCRIKDTAYIEANRDD